MNALRRPLTWWQAVLVIIVAVVIIGAILMWRMKSTPTYPKPEGTPETYEQMQKKPAAGGTF